MDLEKDTFRVRHDTRMINRDTIFSQIQKLGYKPRAIDPAPLEAAFQRSESELPEPILAAARIAQAAGQFLFVDFHAEWCAPCRALEENVLSAPEVREALQNYHSLKVDADSFPQAAIHYCILSLPTLLILRDDGTELDRQIGPTSKSELVRILQRFKRP